jgi:hypothetical protein
MATAGRGGGAAGEDLRIIARAFGAAIPRMALPMPGAVVLAVGVVVAVPVGHRIGEREAAMRGEEIDAPAILPDQVG